MGVLGVIDELRIARNASWVAQCQGSQCLEVRDKDSQSGVEAYKDPEVLTRANALPNVHTFAFGIPYAALGALRPLQVELPDAGNIADESRHVGFERVWV